MTIVMVYDFYFFLCFSFDGQKLVWIIWDYFYMFWDVI